MNKYNRLLLTVSQQYHIPKGQRETELEWKVRLIYSICGMMAYASLWDYSEEPISIIRLKRRIQRTFDNYKSMYPELTENLPSDSKNLENEISSQFLNTGVVYHCPNRIAPSIKHEEQFNDIVFQRGIALDSISYVSGLGFYSKEKGSSIINNIKMMYGLEQENLKTLWNRTLSAARWESNPFFSNNTEYLRLKPPFYNGYWLSEPDYTGSVSILRTGIKGLYTYYLYRYIGTTLQVSQLPSWQVDSYNYRTLACACLSKYGTLPPIEFFEDGELVNIHMNYLLPPHELDFLKLYSWPEALTTSDWSFNRKMSKEVFHVTKKVLYDSGYNFEGGAT